MSILSDAWRRARGEDEAVMRALGAPSQGPDSGRIHWLPWLLCGLLLMVVVGLSVYLWRIHGLAPSGSPSGGAVTATPVQPAASSRQAAETRSSGGAKVSRRRAAAAIQPPADASRASAAEEAAPTKAKTGKAAGKSAALAVSETVPEAVRAQLPALPVTVHVWNPRPAARFIVVNGQIYHEGDTLPHGMRLVSITADGEIVKFEGYLITLNGH